MNRNKEVGYLKFKKVNDQEKIFLLSKWFFLVENATISVNTTKIPL